VAVAAAQPAVVEGQEARQGEGEIGTFGSAGLAIRCAATPGAGDPFLAEVERMHDLEDEAAARAALDALEPEARRMAAEAPNDVTAQYRLAALMGARLDDESGSAKVSGAAELHDQALRVLELDPTHAGASYMVGRLHASVLRLSGIKRFMATRLMGGGALKDASWERAQALLELAVREEPCVPEHHWELARVYAHQGDAEGAERELAYVRELTAGRNGPDARLFARAEELARELPQM
jgi:hypothetical protein